MAKINNSRVLITDDLQFKILPSDNNDRINLDFINPEFLKKWVADWADDNASDDKENITEKLNILK